MKTETCECGKCGTIQVMEIKRYGKKPEDYTLYCPNCKDNISPSACKNFVPQTAENNHSQEDVGIKSHPEHVKGSLLEHPDTRKGFSTEELHKWDFQPNSTIEINNPEGKKLKLDFNGDKLVTSGDLPYDEASKIFIESLDGFFRERLDLERTRLRQEVEKVLNDCLTGEPTDILIEHIKTRLFR